jgi:hypothetical protein
MKTPPLLLGAALVFWGWLTGYAVAGLLMAIILEGSRLTQVRWEFSNDDFRRIWVFCTLLFLAAAVYAFTSNEGVADFRGLFQSPNFFTQRNAGTASARTLATLIRWTPMIFYLFVAAEAFSSRGGVPLETISLILAWRWKKARKLGQRVPASRTVDVSYPYFGVSLVAASVHSARDATFFWGLSVLLAWTLWAHRSRRFSLIIWGAALLMAIGLGHLGQGGITRLQRYLEGFDPRWLSAFARRGGSDPSQSRTSLGQIGRVKTSGKIVIRLEPPEGQSPPQLLREASYRGYRAQTWDAGTSKSDFENVPAETNLTTWRLLPQKTNHAAVNIACYLRPDKKGLRKGLLPLPEGSGRLERLPAYILQKNSAGAVLAEGPGLVIFDTLYGSGQTIDSEPSEEDLAVPPKEEAALSEVVSALQLEGKSRDEAIKILNRHFQADFTYSLWQELDFKTRSDDTPLSNFLRNTHRGHCEYFATATVLLLRKLNIPARYAVGYSVHEASGRKFVVRERDAHAWCLVWNERRRIWQDFDTTPATWVAEEAKRASAMQWLSDAWSRIWFEISKVRWGQTHLRKYLLWSLAPILSLLLFQIISRARRQRRRKEAGLTPAIAWPGLDSEFYHLERRLSERGVTRPPGEPPAIWLQRAITYPGLAAIQESLQQVLRLHYRYRFDPQGLDQSEREALRREAKACLESLALPAAGER